MAVSRIAVEEVHGAVAEGKGGRIADELGGNDKGIKGKTLNGRHGGLLGTWPHDCKGDGFRGGQSSARGALAAP